MAFTYYTATQARTIYAELVNEAAYGGKRIVLTRHGKNIVAIVPMSDLEMLVELQAILDLTTLATLKRQLGLPRRARKVARGEHPARDS